MRIFLLPSWCPSANAPWSGAFFVEQAHALARARPSWAVAICQFDLARSRVPWRVAQWPGFLRTWATVPAITHQRSTSGLHTYAVWAPYLPRFGFHSKWRATADGLKTQARLALRDFVADGGKPDLIHALAVYPGGAAAVDLGREFGVPVALSEHLGPFPPPTLCEADGQPMPIVRDSYRDAAAVSAVSHALAARIVALRLARKVEVLPNFIDDSFGTVAQAGPAPAQGMNLLCVGGPSHAKGTDVLLEALAATRAPVGLTLVGAGPELPEFQRMARALGVAERVRWLPGMPPDRMAHMYRSADALVLPSRGETFGMVLIEALAHGKPLIATRCGGPEDIVHPGNGVLVPVGDAAALTSAIDHMQLACRAFDPTALRGDFLERFAASAVVPRIEAWYRSLLPQGAEHAAR